MNFIADAIARFIYAVIMLALVIILIAFLGPLLMIIFQAFFGWGR